ncbi:MAG: TRAP transporter substrate-binding protein [Rhodobacteraceae bacterium]|nr:TRAP transporter substrate-binding protein [Paracoccaceae bacterium]
MKTISRFVTGTAVFTIMTTMAMAQETTLIISSWAAPSYGVNSQLFPDMIKRIEQATEGRVTAEIKYNLASPIAQADLVADGIADMTWIVHNYTPGRFVTYQLAELPGYGGSTVAYSVAYWRTYEKFFKDLNEHRNLKVLALSSHGAGMFHTGTKITTIDQVSGMKMRIAGGVAQLIGEALGASSINVPAPKVYETLASNAADGVMMPMEAKKGFKLTEVAPYTYSMPAGLYRTSNAIVMNQASFDALSEKDRAALDQLFGEELSRIAGAYWDQFDEEGLAELNATPGNELTVATPEDQAKFDEMTKGVVKQVIENVNETGIDSEAALAFFRAEFDRLKAEE